MNRRRPTSIACILVLVLLGLLLNQAAFAAHICPARFAGHTTDAVAGHDVGHADAPPMDCGMPAPAHADGPAAHAGCTVHCAFDADASQPLRTPDLPLPDLWLGALVFAAVVPVARVDAAWPPDARPAVDRRLTVFRSLQI